MSKRGRLHKIDHVEPVCVECGGLGRMTSGAAAVPHRPERHREVFYVCECGAMVSCHPGTAIPAGLPASSETRRLRWIAHKAFDAIWLGNRGGSGVATGFARKRAYKWLARELGLRPEQTHIGWMDAATCLRVIDICEAKGRRRAA